MTVVRPTVALLAPLALLLTALTPARAEPLIWGLQAEQLEYRFGDDDLFAWDFDAMVGSDELKLVWRSEAEYGLEEDAFEALENQARVQMPISTFFDAVAGIRVSTPEGPDRVHGVVGVHGLAPHWFEVDADLFISDEPFLRLEAEYEALITNHLILTPMVELDLPFTDDPATGTAAWGPTLEAGARLSYDLVDRLLSPYLGVHYERAFGDTAELATREGGDRAELFFVLGTRVLF